MTRTQAHTRAESNGDERLDGGRVLIYSHDTYGLGRLRRCMLIAGALASEPSNLSILVATGSPRVHAFDLPRGCDTVKLPSVAKKGKGQYRARTLGVSLDRVVSVRAEILRTTARSFDPDLILVDHSHVGMHGELWPLFEDLDTWPRRPGVVLGLRDVIDDAGDVRREWDAAGTWDALGSVYDRILVYGDSALPTTAQELHLPERYPGKVTIAGYLGRPVERSGVVENGHPTIVVTAGGGGDGYHLCSQYVSFLESLPAPATFRSVLVTGPFMPGRRRRELRRRCAALRHPVEVTSFTDHFPRLLASAAGVVSMAGYNTVVEVLSAGVPALLMPRRTPTLEQFIRAARLSDLDGDVVRVTHSANPEEIATFVAEVTGTTSRPSQPLPIRLDGLSRTVTELTDVVSRSLAARASLDGALKGKRIAALA